MSAEILARKPYSTHPGDIHLEVVMAKVSDTHMPFVTWIHNKQSKGYSTGHYFETQGKALKDFNERGLT